MSPTGNPKFQTQLDFLVERVDKMDTILTGGDDPEKGMVVKQDRTNRTTEAIMTWVKYGVLGVASQLLLGISVLFIFIMQMYFSHAKEPVQVDIPEHKDKTNLQIVTPPQASLSGKKPKAVQAALPGSVVTGN